MGQDKQTSFFDSINTADPKLAESPKSTRPLHSYFTDKPIEPSPVSTSILRLSPDGKEILLPKGEQPKPELPPPPPAVVEPILAPVQEVDPLIVGKSPEELFDRHYFDCGTKVGGYPPPGYRDDPRNEIIAKHILARRPESVLELGCARGYVLKRIQDVGVPFAQGMDVSRHCLMTRACNGWLQWDVTKPWPYENGKDGTATKLDLCYSIDFFDRIPEDKLPIVFIEMERAARRGLHALDFNLDGFDKTRQINQPIEWWRERMPKNHEVCDIRAVSSGQLPVEVLSGDGLLKTHFGSFTTCFHYGWENIDLHDLGNWAMMHGYRYRRHDVRTGLPYDTGTVSAICHMHLLEHLSYAEGLSFLRECRRVIKPEGIMRLGVPNAELLIDDYKDYTLGRFDELNGGCASTDTGAGKLWELLLAGNHKAIYDEEALKRQLEEAGFVYYPAKFRQTGLPVGHSHEKAAKQIEKECTDALPEISLFATAVPLVG